MSAWLIVQAGMQLVVLAWMRVPSCMSSQRPGAGLGQEGYEKYLLRVCVLACTITCDKNHSDLSYKLIFDRMFHSNKGRGLDVLGDVHLEALYCSNISFTVQQFVWNITFCSHSGWIDQQTTSGGDTRIACRSIGLN